jgi:hypothetical protein
VQAAVRQYQDMHGIDDWTLHADYLEVELDGSKLDFCPKGLGKPVGKAPALSWAEHWR